MRWITQLMYSFLRFWWWLTRQQLGPVYDASRVAKLLGLRYLKEELAAFGLPPLPRPNVITVFDPGLSIVQFREKLPGLIKSEWSDSMSFAQETAEPGYRQVPMQGRPLKARIVMLIMVLEQSHNVNRVGDHDDDDRGFGLNVVRKF